MMTDQVFARAMLLAGEDCPVQAEMLQTMCSAVVSSLEARLKDGITPEDCQEPFVTAAGLYALAALGEGLPVEEFKAGDLTIKHGGGEASALCRRQQADLLMAPYLKDRFSFLGV